MGSADNHNSNTGVFVPLNGQFVMDMEAPAQASFNDIGAYLGYHPDQLHSYLGDYDMNSDIYGVGFAYLTDKVIYVSVKSHISELSTAKVNEYLKKFDKESEYDHPSITDHLRQAIENQSFTSSFVADILSLPEIEPDSIIDVPSLGLYLYFNNGLLTDFQPSDGLNEWAKHLRQLNPKWMKSFERVAQKYWKDDVRRIVQEINIQAEAYSEIPQGLKNPFLPLHESEENTYNFRMLMVTHYSAPLVLDQFKIVNHGRYREVQEKIASGLQKYITGKFLYEFDTDGGSLLNFYQVVQ